MSIVKEENTDTENSSFKRMWLLVQWVGSFPEDAFDIINATDVVLDDYSPTIDSLRIGSAIMVRCGRTKSPAHVQQISDNTDTLIGELRRLQKLVLKEASTNKIKTTPKIQNRKRKFVDENSDMKKSTTKGTQTDDVVDENIITKLIQENQKLKAELYESNKIINSATRKLLMTVFSRQILATHSLTGKPSPAFIACDMPAKMKLDPVKVSDIVEIVSARCGVSESMVRGAITTKCADENKMFKKRLEKSRDKIECDE
ncbi:insensitive [Carabus blaptoides fortunei]